MEEDVKALLVQVRPGPLEALQLALMEQSIEIRTVKNCEEAEHTLCSD
jgi:hypothetical protein